METKHTKGEWVIYDSNILESTIKTTNGIRIAEVKSFGALRSNIKLKDATFEEKEANAKLIAAAPDLLEALNLCVNIFEDNGYNGVFSEEKTVIINAIKKATE